ncbi:MAG: response regulator transcription factor [Oscillospiraceae bacterium]|nr:response regulator transcription factor [Oscillospiraceae bacterium]
MNCFYISIEKNIKVFELYKVLWKERGIEGIRADTMTEGIEKAIEIERSKTDELYFIDIVADDVDYMPQLRILCEETNAPILIATSNYNEIERDDALNNGADAYGAYSEISEQQDLNGVVAVINSINKRAKKRKSPSRIISHGDILIAADYHQAFIKDKELFLTGLEMKLMQYLMINRGNVLSHGMILQEVYNDDGEVSLDSLYSTVKRLRKKINDIAKFKYIQTVREVGYRLITNSSKE